MKPQPMDRTSTFFYTGLAFVSALYLGITILTPINPQAITFNLGATQLRLLQLTIVLPIIAIWFAALWGSLRFKRYAQSIIGRPDGRALNQVASGLLTLVSALAISTVVQSLSPDMLDWGHHKAWVIFSNYLSVVMSLTAFALIARGAWALAALVDYQKYRRYQWVAVVGLAALGVLYVWLLTANPYRTSSPNPARITPYYLSDWLILLTLVLPYLIIWYTGLMAGVCVWLYQAHAKGIIYRQSLSRLSIGLFAIIGTSILIQLITVVSASLNSLGLAGVLALLYLLILIYAIGHVLVALGARKLERIEEVVPSE